jgi:hypothetical protein
MYITYIYIHLLLLVFLQKKMRPYALSFVGHALVTAAWWVMPQAWPKLVGWVFASFLVLTHVTTGLLLGWMLAAVTKKQMKHEAVFAQSLVGLGMATWAMVDCVQAKTAAVTTSDPWILGATRAMWITEIAGTITILTMLSLALFVQLVSLIASTRYLIERCRAAETRV